jgi:hypothetical protein
MRKDFAGHRWINKHLQTPRGMLTLSAKLKEDYHVGSKSGPFCITYDICVSEPYHFQKAAENEIESAYIRPDASSLRSVVPLQDRLTRAELARLDSEVASRLNPSLGYISYKRWDGVERRSGLKLGDIYKVHFLPFGENPFREMPYLLGKGIASELELAISKDVMAKYGPQQRIIHRNPEDTRERHLARLGIEVNRWYVLAEHVRIVEENILMLRKKKKMK